VVRLVVVPVVVPLEVEPLEVELPLVEEGEEEEDLPQDPPLC